MKLALVCDEIIIRHNGMFYAENAERKGIFLRYLRVFDSLKLILRCENEDNLLPSRVLLDEEEIDCYPITNFQGPIQYASHYFEVGQSLKKAVDDCDAAILRLPSTLSQRVAPTIKRRGIPYACEVVFDAVDGYKTSTSVVEYLLWKIIHKQMVNICKDADGVSCVTENYLQQHYYSEKPNHFESHYSSLSLPKSFWASPRSYPQKKVLIAGHLSWKVYLDGVKGYKEVIQALAVLKKEKIDVLVRFAGQDYNNGVEKIKKYAEKLGVLENIEYVGFLNRSQIESFLENCDLFIFPTKAEGLPRVLIEAMAKGLPVVTTPVSGNPELIQEHFLVDYHDVNNIAEKIKELVEDSTVYEKESSDNFEKSQKYEASILEKRRDTFYKLLYERCK